VTPPSGDANLGDTAKPRAFVVYSHESDEHRDRVWDLVHRLRESGGVEAWFDGYEEAPAQGWPRWSVEQIDKADFVLVVCSPALRRRFEGNEELGVGLGTRWEAKAITDRLYEAGGRNEKFLPVLLDGEPESSIPNSLRGYHFFRDPEKDDGLLRVIHRSPRRKPVAVAGRPALPTEVVPPRAREVGRGSAFARRRWAWMVGLGFLGIAGVVWAVIATRGFDDTPQGGSSVGGSPRTPMPDLGSTLESGTLPMTGSDTDVSIAASSGGSTTEHTDERTSSPRRPSGKKRPKRTVETTSIEEDRPAVMSDEPWAKGRNCSGGVLSGEAARAIGVA